MLSSLYAQWAEYGMEIKVKEFFGKCFYYQYLWGKRDFHGGSDGKESACNAKDLGSISGSGRSLEKGMATHSSILAWRILWTQEPGGLQSMGSKESDMVKWLTLSHFHSRGREGRRAGRGRGLAMIQSNQVFTLSHRSSGAEMDHQSCPGWGSVSLHTLTVIRYGLPSKAGGDLGEDDSFIVKCW